MANLAGNPTTAELTARVDEGDTKKTSQVSIRRQGLITYADILVSLGLAGTFGPLEITSIDNKPLLASQGAHNQN